MQIELGHNPINLPFRTRVLVHNPTLANRRLEEFTDARWDRGYRLRIVTDKQLGGFGKGVIELGSRGLSQVKMAIAELKTAGYYIKELYWETNALIRNK